ncbi:hypothetical protein TNCV_1713481 [Trichonephila clavipes]|nr:hypothetical protein TNCV_1713481 [Trichonephila clavipes]
MLIYKLVLRPILQYASPIWGHAAYSNIKMLESAQNKIIKIITDSPWALATELTSTLSILLIKRLRLGNGQPTYRHGTGTSRIASERYEDTFASDYTICKQACVDALMMMPDHHPDEPFYVRALTELQDIEETMALAVSDIDSFEPCIIPGCPHHDFITNNKKLL